jgi:hypothetical protein
VIHIRLVARWGWVDKMVGGKEPRRGRE